MAAPPPVQLWTVGHSTHSLEALAAALQRCGVRRVIDVRSFPGSRRNPQFGREALAAALPSRGLSYDDSLHARLGGRRPAARARAGDANANAGWRSASFRNYADFMATPQFEASLAELLRRAAETPTAILCAESVPWRCHRNLISDAATARGAAVHHIMLAPSGAVTQREHALTSFAVVRAGGRVEYPAPPPATKEKQKEAAAAAEQGNKSKRRRSASPLRTPGVRTRGAAAREGAVRA